MNAITRSFSRYLATLLVCSMVAASVPAYASKPLTPQQIHERILKRGVGNWVGVELQNGTAFAGRIVSADEESFGLQLHNDPTITPVRYGDVVNLHMGLSNGAFWGLMAAGIGGVAAMAAVGFYEVHKHSQMPAMPAEPTGPAFP